MTTTNTARGAAAPRVSTTPAAPDIRIPQTGHDIPATEISSHDKVKYYQVGSFAVGNRLVPEALRSVQSEADRFNSLTSGHRACQGCGEALGARYAVDLLPYALLFLMRRESKTMKKAELFTLLAGFALAVYGSLMIHL